MSEFQQKIRQRIEVARGLAPADWVIRGARVFDVFSGRWTESDLSSFDGIIVGVDPGLRAKREISGKGKWLVPGFIDAHVHVESSCLVPNAFDRAVLPRGTTTAIADPHELANVQGVSGIQYFLEASTRLQMDLWIMMSSCVPATHLETNGGGAISAHELLALGRHPRALGLAEMMNVPGVLNADSSILEKLEAFQNRPLDGHCPLLRGPDLSAYALAGLSSCHESSQREEAAEKLRKGLAVWIREGSVAKDLDELVPLLNPMSSAHLGFCTDDRNPLDILNEGHIDHLVRRALASGIATEAVYRAASWSVADHYGLNRNPARRVGALAPGFDSDVVMLSDRESCAIEQVFKRGVPVHEMEFAPAKRGSFENSIRCELPTLADLRAPEGSVHVIGAQHGKILTEHRVMESGAPGVRKLTVLERHGKGHRPANAYVYGFGLQFRGAIVSSVGHDSHNLIGVYDRPEDLRAGFAALKEMGGGFAVVQDGKVLAALALPLGGLMSDLEPIEVGKKLSALKTASRAIGCELPEPFLQLAFLSLPVIPSLKLTDQGLVDVERFAFIDVRAS